MLDNSLLTFGQGKLCYCLLFSLNDPPWLCFLFIFRSWFGSPFLVRSPWSNLPIFWNSQTNSEPWLAKGRFCSLYISSSHILKYHHQNTTNYVDLNIPQLKKKKTRKKKQVNSLLITYDNIITLFIYWDFNKKNNNVLHLTMETNTFPVRAEYLY